LRGFAAPFIFLPILCILPLFMPGIKRGKMQSIGNEGFALSAAERFCEQDDGRDEN